MKNLRTGMLLGAALLATQAGFANHADGKSGTAKLESKVRRELVMLPFYSLFDQLSFRLDGDTVTLIGKVSRPTLKSDAEGAVKQIEGVLRVDNQIEVLPLSPNDDRLRRALFASIYGHSTLQTLAIRAIPPIHIIVRDGHVTLEGVVGSEMQKNIAGVQANTVSGVFSVTNNLRVDSGS